MPYTKGSKLSKGLMSTVITIRYTLTLKYVIVKDITFQINKFRLRMTKFNNLNLVT